MLSYTAVITYKTYVVCRRHGSKCRYRYIFFILQFFVSVESDKISDTCIHQVVCLSNVFTFKREWKLQNLKCFVCFFLVLS